MAIGNFNVKIDIQITIFLSFKNSQYSCLPYDINNYLLVNLDSIIFLDPTMHVTWPILMSYIIQMKKILKTFLNIERKSDIMGIRYSNLKANLGVRCLIQKILVSNFTRLVHSKCTYYKTQEQKNGTLKHLQCMQRQVTNANGLYYKTHMCQVFIYGYARLTMRANTFMYVVVTLSYKKFMHIILKSYKVATIDEQ